MYPLFSSVRIAAGGWLLPNTMLRAEDTISLTVDREVVCVGEAITGSASLNYYGGNNRPSVAISPVLPENQVPDAGPSTKNFSFQTADSTTPGEYTITATVSGAYPATKKVKVLKFEIEINRTSVTDDDVVFWSDFAVCGNRFQTPARIRQVASSSSTASAVDVTLNTSKPSLEYAQSGGAWGKTLSLTLPQDGSWMDFQVSGVIPSLAVGDMPIEVQVSGHSGVCFRKPMTVFWFVGNLKLTPGAPYEASKNGTKQTLAAEVNNAIEMSAYADIKPEGVSAAAPQIAELRIGIVQNVRSVSRSATDTSPDVYLWNSSYPSGRTALFPAALLSMITIPGPLLDSSAVKSPLYTANIQMPRNLGGKVVETSDNPKFIQPLTLKWTSRTAGGRPIARASYSIAAMTIDETYRTWCVVYNTTTKVLRPLTQEDWSLPAITDTNLGKATAAGGMEAKNCPIRTPPFANASIIEAVTPSAQSVAIPKP